MQLDKRKASLGFSLIELMVVLLIISILTLLSSVGIFDGFKRIKARAILNSNSHALIQAAHLARQQAISRQTFVTLWPVCGNRWDSGWMVFIHPNWDFKEPQKTDVLVNHFSVTEITTSPPIMGQRTQRLSGNEFEDISLNNNQKPCPLENKLTPQSSTGKLKHISFNPAGGAQMKNGGLVANRIRFWSRDFPDIEQQIIMGAGGRLRICTPSQENPTCR